MKTNITVRVAAIMLGIVVLPAFSSEWKNDPRQEQFAFKIFEPGLLHHPMSGVVDKDFRALFGEPSSIQHLTEQSKYIPGKILYKEIWKYPGLKATFYVSRYYGKRSTGLNILEISDKRYLLNGGLRIGDPEEKVTRVLGIPHIPAQPGEDSSVYLPAEPEKNYFVYLVESHIRTSVDITTTITVDQDRRVTRILWEIISGD
ncbi:MAG: hypothetical protein BMS9Abin36_0177 [Gammaproteobacteria bacterium]|nr:MAG: hypothetical protein BMS9Abin36_0177 [Gammaproteobacteria bacterium]